MRHENQQKLRHSGQRVLLIRNPRFSTVYWIPGQARYDGFLVNGTAVMLYLFEYANKILGVLRALARTTFVLTHELSRRALFDESELPG